MKAKKRNYTLHWKLMEPYNFFIVVATGPDINGIKKELRRAFTKPKDSDETMPDEYFDNAHINPDAMHTKDGLTIFDEKSDNIVIYCKDIKPPLPTLAHELYHAVRHSARSFGFEQSEHDEAEAYLFERAFEYFSGKIGADCRAMAGAEHDRGDGETVEELRKYLKEAFAVICDDCETKVCKHCVRNMRWRKAIEGVAK